MTVPLEAPRSASELYLARRSQVPLLRPAMTGDVFKGIEIPGVGRVEGDEDRLAMIVTHPCSMRQGPRLRDHLQMVRVIRTAPLDLGAWKGSFDRMPLPSLMSDTDIHDINTTRPNGVPEHYAGILEYRGRVPTKDLSIRSRMACLSEEGVAYLHQRMSNADTRYAPRVRDLMISCGGVFAEAELEQDWKEEFVEFPEKYTPEALSRLLIREATIFDEILSVQRVHRASSKTTVKSSLREDLSDEQKRYHARREIRRIMNNRPRPVVY